MWASAVPSVAMMISRTARAVAVPVNADRQPRTLPTARTTVRASTHSTREARKDARIDVPMCAQLEPMYLILARWLYFDVRVGSNGNSRSTSGMTTRMATAITDPLRG